MTSWSTITVTKEKPEHVRAFVAWHLGAGADEVILFYDDPSGAVTDFDHLPQVRVILGNTEYWSDSVRPNSRGARQVHGATMAYGLARTDWVLHCDTDEFVYGEAIPSLLGAVPTDMATAQILPIERIFSDDEIDQSYSNIFRSPIRPKHARKLAKIYEYPHQLTQGLRGHRNGKVFIRSGLEDIIIRPHNAEISGVLQNDPILRATLSDLKLLHIYTFGFEHFRTKGEWKFRRGPEARKRDAAITDPSSTDLRRIEMAEVIEVGDIDKMRAIFDDTFVFTEERLARLAKIQEIQTLNFTQVLQDRMQNYFP